jgi:hypothetical protein
LEALHQVSGRPIVSDFYTHLYPTETVSVRNQPLFEALNQLADAMRVRWNKVGNWIQLRSASFYDDRLKEVPNRLLARWSSARRQHGALTLDELLEITGLPDAQLDASDMAEGARECFGLREWDVARNRRLRPHLRCLALLTPAQRREAMSPTGLPFRQMSLAQQQAFTALMGPYSGSIHSLEELAAAALHVQHTQPGGFGLEMPPGPFGKAFELSMVRERTRAAALEAAHRLDPRITEAQIAPTELAVTVVYTWGSPQSGAGQLLTRATAKGFRDWFGRVPSDGDGAQDRRGP